MLLLRRWVALVAAVALLITGIPPTVSVAAPVSITLFASPQTIRADGKSTSQITIQVRDASGHPVPDGTEVRLTTTVGSITPVAHTSGGVATAMLTAGTTPAIAVVSAAVTGNSNGIQVEFVTDDVEVRATRTVKLDGAVVYYTAEQNQFFAAELATLDYQGLKISADQIQYDSARDVIKAQGSVAMTRGNRSLSGEEIVYYPSSNRGVMIRIGKEIETLEFRGDNLEATPSKFPLGTEELAALKPEPSRISVEASRAVLFPGEKIQFTNATIMVEDSPVIKLPHYIISLSGSYTRNPLEQQVRYTSSEGLVLDIPFYFGVTEKNSTALKLRYSSSGSDYSDYYLPRKGLSLGFQQDYSLGSGGQGRLALDSLLHSDRRLDLTHRQEFGGGAHADLTLGYQPKSFWADNTLYGYASFSKPLGKYHFSLTASENRGTTASGSYRNPSARASFRMLDRRVGKLPFSIGTEVAFGYGRAYTSKYEGFTSNAERDFYQSLGVTLRPNSWRLGKQTVVASSLRGEQTFFANGQTGRKIGAEMSLQQSLGKSSGLRLGYTCSLQTGSLGGSYSPSNNLVTMDLYSSKGSKFHSNLNVTYGFGRNRTMLAYANASYRFTPTWRMLLRANLSQSWIPLETDLPMRRFQYDYTQLGVAKNFGNFEISLNYSPQGRQAFGTGGSDARFWLEVGANSW